MTDTFVLLAAAAILPLLLLLFAFVGCETHSADENPQAWVEIGPGSFGNIERVDIKVRFDNEEHPHHNHFSSPTEGEALRFECSHINAKENGEVKSVKIILTCELVPKIPQFDTLVKTEDGDSIYMKRFVLSGEEFAFSLEPIPEA
jgi:hypothetical protein